MPWSMGISWNSVLDFVRMAVEFLLIAFVIYKTLYYLRGTRAVNVLAGLVVAFLVLYIISVSLKLTVVSWLLNSFMNLMAFTIIVIFQPELRRAFAQLGSYTFFQRNRKRETINELVAAVNSMASRRCGAIIVIERRIGMRAIVEDAIKLDSKLNNLLIQSIFYPNSPLHDGAVIVNNERIVAAAAILPVSNRELKDRSMGLRHRAGIGLAEASDAVVIIVSEETGSVSLAVGNVVQRDINLDLLTENLTKLLYSHATQEQITEVVHH